MTILQALLFSSYLSSVHGSCPFAGNGSKTGAEEFPNDPQHQSIRQQKEVSEERARHAHIINKAQQRNLQTNCITSSTYEHLMDDVGALGNAFNSNNGARGHFFGGLVRLAAHDFMDFDLSARNQGGPDGCIDFTASINNGLEIVWCDNGCPLKDLYDTSYSFMSRADFWVAAANACIRATALNGYDLPFRWGRTDVSICPESSARLPLDTGCDQVEGVFLTRMGLSWTDATALLGAHSLGRATDGNSQHDGTWVQSGQESTVFDKGFYDELTRRSWRPLSRNGAQHDWTWGGNTRGVMMLNTDICLFFDISNPNCCTNTGGNCRDTGNQCPTSRNTETVSAINAFMAGRNNDNDAFYAAFSVAWKKATELGHTGLKNLDTICDSSPTLSPTPSIPCGDKNCQFVADNGLCDVYGDLCPVSCSVSSCGNN